MFWMPAMAVMLIATFRVFRNGAAPAGRGLAYVNLCAFAALIGLHLNVNIEASNLTLFRANSSPYLYPSQQNEDCVRRFILTNNSDCFDSLVPRWVFGRPEAEQMARRLAELRLTTFAKPLQVVLPAAYRPGETIVAYSPYYLFLVYTDAAGHMVP